MTATACSTSRTTTPSPSEIERIELAIRENEAKRHQAGESVEATRNALERARVERQGLAVEGDSGRLWLLGSDWIGRFEAGRFELLEQDQAFLGRLGGRWVAAADRRGGR